MVRIISTSELSATTGIDLYDHVADGHGYKGCEEQPSLVVKQKLVLKQRPPRPTMPAKKLSLGRVLGSKVRK